jgi:hypothetical protein
MSGALFLTGCAERWQYGFVTDAQVSLPPYSYEVDRSRRAGSAPEWLDVRPGGNQTVLIAVWSQTESDKIDEIDTRTYVVVLDGPPMKGHYEVTPANGRFIPGTNWYPPRKPYEGLEGSVEIKSITGSKVEAYCGLRNVLTMPADPLYPLRGHYTFVRVPAGKSRMGAVRLQAGTVPE